MIRQDDRIMADFLRNEAHPCVFECLGKHGVALEYGEVSQMTDHKTRLHTSPSVLTDAVYLRIQIPEKQPRNRGVPRGLWWLPPEQSGRGTPVPLPSVAAKSMAR